jgi:hypothetical protein
MRKEERFHFVLSCEVIGRTVKLVLKKRMKAVVITPGHCKRFCNDTTISLFWGFNNNVEHVKEKLKKESSQFHQPPPPSLFFGAKNRQKLTQKWGL